MVRVANKCATCGKEFKKNALLQQHVRRHTGEKPYDCYLCDKKFDSKSHAQRHMNSHSKNTLLLSCTVEGCPKQFKFERTMKRHIQSTHILHKCTFEGCEMAFNKKFKLKKHMREIHNDIYLKCTHEGCTSVFTTKRNLARHLYSHEREYECNFGL
ncbi:transcription factor IIIA-like [Dendronephthya gigantea]|uniref:transcription factor IIIA-like n=1 Tax=Dendronephthya gigantea TaxID=151771 RepID=UPI00106D455F|nr:transcription factor IIIA-like [Dendronephthya gigantea]